MPASTDEVQILAYAHAAIRMHKRRRQLTAVERDELLGFITRLTHTSYQDRAVVVAIEQGVEAAIADLDYRPPWE